MGDSTDVAGEPPDGATLRPRLAVRVGVAGRRKLGAMDPAGVTRQIREVISTIDSLLVDIRDLAASQLEAPHRTEVVRQFTERGESIKIVRADWSFLDVQAAPLIHFVSPLALGADTLGANAALAARSDGLRSELRLTAVLPSSLEKTRDARDSDSTGEADFPTPEARHALERAHDAADTVICLSDSPLFEAADRQHAFESQARLLLEQVDVLFVVMENPDEHNFTRKVREQALRAGTFVIDIDGTNPPRRARIDGDSTPGTALAEALGHHFAATFAFPPDEHDEDLANETRRGIFRPFLRRLVRLDCLLPEVEPRRTLFDESVPTKSRVPSGHPSPRPSILPFDLSISNAWLGIFGWPKKRAEQAKGPLASWLTHPLEGERIDCRESSNASHVDIVQSLASPLEATEGLYDRFKQAFGQERLFTIPDALASIYANQSRAKMMFGALVGVVPLAFADDANTLGDLARILVLVSVVVYLLVRRARYHERSIEYRALSEEHRQSLFLAPLGLTPRRSSSWTGRLLSAHERVTCLGSSRSFTPAWLQTHFERMHELWILDQRAYHQSTVMKTGAFDVLLFRLFLFFLIVPAILLTFFRQYFASGTVLGLGSFATASSFMLGLSAAAIFLRSQLHLRTSVIRSTETYVTLTRLDEDRYEPWGARPPERRRWSDLANLAQHTSDLMLRENQEWREMHARNEPSSPVG